MKLAGIKNRRKTAEYDTPPMQMISPSPSVVCKTCTDNENTGSAFSGHCNQIVCMFEPPGKHRDDSARKSHFCNVCADDVRRKLVNLFV